MIVRLVINLPKGTSIFMDRYFPPIPLLDELHVLGFQGTGTLQLDRIPPGTPLYTDAELRGGGRGYINQVVRNDGQVAIIKWLDNKPVILATTIHGAEPKDKCRRWSKTENRYIEVDRPIVVKYYNDKMGGVYLLDRMISYYRISARTKKWTVRLVFHMFDFVIAAGWIHHRRVEAAENTPKRDKTDLLAYKTDLADRLLQDEAEMDLDEDGDDGVDVLPEAPPKTKKVTPKPDFYQRTSGVKHLPGIVTARSTRHRCRFPGCSSTNSRFFCGTCKVHLCITTSINCYKLFHEL